MNEALRIVAIAVAGICAVFIVRMRLKVDAERQKSGEKGIEAWARYHGSLGKRPLYWILMAVAVLCFLLMWYLGGTGP